MYIFTYVRIFHLPDMSYYVSYIQSTFYVYSSSLKKSVFIFTSCCPIVDHI